MNDSLYCIIQLHSIIFVQTGKNVNDSVNQALF